MAMSCEDIVLIKDGREIFRMHAFDAKTNNSATEFRARPEDPESFNLRQAFVQHAGEVHFPSMDVVQTGRLNPANSCAQSDHLDDGHGASFEAGGWRRPGGFVECHLSNHVTTKMDGLHFLKPLRASIEHPHSGGPINLVPTKDQKVDVVRNDVCWEVWNALSTIDDETGTDCVGTAGQFADGIDGSQHV